MFMIMRVSSVKDMPHYLRGDRKKMAVLKNIYSRDKTKIFITQKTSNITVQLIMWVVCLC